MIIGIVSASLFGVLLAAGHVADAVTVQARIKQLGSQSFQEREAATKWLMRHSQAAPALRDALRSPDPEIRKRAALVLEHHARRSVREHARRSVRELEAATKSGDIERFIALLAEWPKDHYEDAAWREACGLARTLLDLHKKDGGAPIDLLLLRAADPPLVIVTPIAKEEIEYRAKCLFLRAGSVTVNKFPPPNDSVIVTSGPVHMVACPLHRSVIVARGPVEINGYAQNAVILSCDDVTMEMGLHNALVIARGKVVCKGHMKDSRIISGKSVVCNRKNAINCIITENEPNPLGFIRFTPAATKDVGVPKNR